MRKTLPPMSQRPPEALDSIWFFAFPIFYLVMTGYGFFAAFFPITAVQAVNGIERAQVFGALIAAVGTVLIAGTVVSTLRRLPHLEFWATVAFLLLMAVYFDALYMAVTHHEVGSRPGSTFLPLLFSVFPFTRLLVIARSGRMRWPRIGRRSTR